MDMITLGSMHQRIEKSLNLGQEMIQKRQKDAAEHKQKTLEMYDQMAKSAPAGGQKIMNVNMLRSQPSVDKPELCAASGPKRDLVEEAIRDRVKAADMEKKRILAAYDAAARSGPAGTYRVADLKNFTKDDGMSPSFSWDLLTLLEHRCCTQYK